MVGQKQNSSVMLIKHSTGLIDLISGFVCYLSENLSQTIQCVRGLDGLFHQAEPDLMI